MFERIKKRIIELCVNKIVEKINIDYVAQEIESKAKLKLMTEVDKHIHNIITNSKTGLPSDRKDYISIKDVKSVGKQYAKTYIDEKTKELTKYNRDFNTKDFVISGMIQEKLDRIISEKFITKIIKSILKDKIK